MTLLWCLIAILVALGIARFNQSNKLFWILLISFLAGIAGAAVFEKLKSTDGDQSKVKLTQVCPTQNLQGIQGVTDLPYGDILVVAECHEPASVSQDNTPELCEPNFTLSKWIIPARTPPPQILQV